MLSFGSKSNKKISWFARLTGAAPEILEKCSATCRNAFNYAGMTLLFTAIVSAAIIAFAVSTYSFKNMMMFPLIFLVWCVFVWSCVFFFSCFVQAILQQRLCFVFLVKCTMLMLYVPIIDST